MGGAILALIVLVVLPLLSLLLGSVRGEQGLSLDHFGEVLTGRLYVNALKNSLILGAWTGLLSVVIGLPLAWAVSRTDVPGKPLIHVTATPVLPLAAVPHRHRLRQPVQPQRRPHQRAGARRARACRGSPSTSSRWPGWSWSPCCTRSRSSTCWRRARCSRSTRPRRNRRRSSAPASCAPRWRSPRRWWRRRSCRARCSPSSTPSRCSARRRSSACPAASSRCRRASTRCSTIRRSTGWLRRCRCVFVAHHRGRALSAARVPGPALLRHARRQGRAAAAHASSGRRAGWCSPSAC